MSQKGLKQHVIQSTRGFEREKYVAILGVCLHSLSVENLTQRTWLKNQILKKPLDRLDAAQDAHFSRFNELIGVYSIWRIIHNEILRWKVSSSFIFFIHVITSFQKQCLEKRAIQIKKKLLESQKSLISLDWLPSNLVFLDKLSAESRATIAKRRYGITGNIHFVL
jgi:hypothetical protein